MGKKIGIITIYVVNYGAVLQTYALQKYLKSCEDVSQVEIVNFYTKEVEKIFKRYKSHNIIKNLILKFVVLLRYPWLYRRKLREKAFEAEEFSFTRRYENPQYLLEHMPPSDIYITGSDQVFNPNTRYKRVFYLDFNKPSNAIKVAYAPSVGLNSLPQEIENEVSKYLSDFDFLSCREDTGAKYLSHISQKEVQWVTDPTLLLDCAQWERMGIAPHISGDFILVYDLNGGRNLIEIAVEIKCKTHLPIVCITQKPQSFNRNVYRYIYSAGPREFVGWFNKASYVVTDSFHGTMFSLIFRRPFFVYIASHGTSSRLYSILRYLGLEKRIVNEKGSLLISEPCFDDKFESLMGDYIQSSKNYINQFLHYNQYQ